MPHVPIERHALENGLRVVLSRDPRAPAVAVNLWYDVGSKHEKAGKTGFVRVAWDTIRGDGEKELAKEAISVRCLQTADGGLPKGEDEPGTIAYVARSY